jgi:hypothetical protein
VWRYTVGRSSGYCGPAEKKTLDATPPRPEKAQESVAFLAAGGEAQKRYERLRAYRLLEPALRARCSPAQFDGYRFERFGLLGLVDGASLVQGPEGFSIRLVPLAPTDAEERLVQLYELLATLVTEPQGGGDATGRALRESLDGIAGEGANHPEPARRHHALR